LAIAKLIKGEDYIVKGTHFKNGVEKKMNEELKEYLAENPQFEIKEDKNEQQLGKDNEEDNEGTEVKKTSGTKGKGKKQEGEE
jgi:hypothetical protein